MKVPISWLKEYIDVDFSVEELADKLIFSGIEVEGIETVGSSFDGVVVGEVLSIEKHPNADRLRLCRVSNGTEALPVVCGASNFEVGDKIPFAGVGVRLAEDFKIKKAKIRGEVSEGMLCAEDELGISDDHEGIMLLSRDIAAGTPLVDVMGTPEVVIDLEITWNRSDCLSMIGVAREVAALFEANMKVPTIEFAEDSSSAADMVKVSIDIPEDCQRYTARVLSGIKLGPSPAWMQKRIELCGIRPINNVVDITNYVMLESGQPLHAFDFAKVSGGEIKVRRARDGEVMKTLDDVERKLDPGMLVIADKNDAVALAGVMGGAGSEISEQTEKVLLESALFDPALIHNTSNRMGLSSESSHRFERSVDSERVEWASRRAAQLMVEHAGASVAGGFVDCKPVEIEQAVVVCRYQKVWDLLGYKVEKEEILSIFNRLKLPIIANDEDSCTVKSPTFRHDIKIEADLIEEVARMHGLDAVPEVDLIARIVPGADDGRSRAVREFRRKVIGLGFCECMHYSFVSQRLLDLFDEKDTDSRVVLPNPVSKEYEIMRNTLIPQLTDTLWRNMAHQTLSASVFEIGRVFIKNSDGTIREEERISLGMMGNVGRFGPDGNKPVLPEEIFLWLKGAIEQILAAQQIENIEFMPLSSAVFEPGWAVEVSAKGKKIGVFGLLGSGVKHKSIVGPIALAEFSIDSLCSSEKEKKKLKALPAYPGIKRDMAMIVDENITHQKIVENIVKNAPVELTSINLFDIFRLVNEEAGKTSLAYSLMYRSLERSLTDEEANKFHESIKKSLEDELRIQFR